MPVLFPRRRRRFPVRVAGGDSKARTKAIITVAEKMEEFSKITGSIEQLNNTMTSLLNAVGELPKAEQDYIKAEHQKDIEEEEIWETVRDTAKDQEKETVDSWKDELNNLLVFAGLFSAVVTAFTVESYTWLQQDPGDATNALLAQMSQQLSRLTFMITFVGNPLSSALVNSTSPAPAAEPPFSPMSYAVSVNTLWVLSLTLSLISAFFAIAAQQWLRQLHLPPEMPVRRAVQLLEARKDGLKTWQVPSIIALLPLLLQIAVIFFLVGLFLLLRSLNATVATAFGSVAVIGLLAFLATVFVPLFTSQCPYKTPLVPTVVVILQCLSYPFAVLSLPLAFSLKRVLRPYHWSIVETHPEMFSHDYPIWWSVHKFYNSALLPFLKSFGRHMFVDIGQFWLIHEYQYICPPDEANLPGNRTFERSSLAQTFLSTPARCSTKVSQLLDSSQGDTSVWGVQGTVVSSLRAFRTGLKWSDLLHFLKLDSEMAPYIGKWLSARHHRLLWHHLQQREWTRDGEVELDDSQCLIVFHELDKAFPATRPRYFKHLLQTCAQQRLLTGCWIWETVPACLVLDLVLNRGYFPDETDTDALLGFTLKVYDNYRDGVDLDSSLFIGECRLFLVSTALALIAVNKSGDARSAGITSTVSILAGVLDKESTKESAVSELQSYYEDVDKWSRMFPEYMRPARMMEALCEALSDYAANPLLSPSWRHLLHFGRISNALRTICSQEDYKARPEMAKAREHLDVFDVRVKESIVPGITISNTAIALTMEALVLAEARFQRADTNGDGDCTPVMSSSTGGPNLNGTSRLPPGSAESAVTTGTVVHNNNMESVEFTKNNEGQDSPGIAASADHSDSLPSPSAETHTAENDTDADSASLAAAGSDAPTSSAQLIPEIRETTTVSASEPREAQTDASSPPAVEGASSSAQSQGSEARTALYMNSVAVEDDAPRNEGNVGVESVSSGENAASSGTTGGE